MEYNDYSQALLAFVQNHWCGHKSFSLLLTSHHTILPFYVCVHIGEVKCNTRSIKYFYLRSGECRRSCGSHCKGAGYFRSRRSLSEVHSERKTHSSPQTPWSGCSALQMAPYTVGLQHNMHQQCQIAK